MEMSMRRGTHLHLQGPELPKMEEEKKEKAKNSLSLLGQPAHNKRGGCFSLL